MRQGKPQGKTVVDEDIIVIVKCLISFIIQQNIGLEAIVALDKIPYQPSRGQVFFKGKEITGAKPHKLMRLGVGRSFQITSTFNRLTTFQNIRLAILSKKGIRFHLFSKVDKMQDITKETDEVLKRINLDRERDVPAGMWSYGKHRSLEISLALATRRSIWGGWGSR